MSAVYLILIVITILLCDGFMRKLDARQHRKWLEELAKATEDVEKCPPHKWSHHPVTEALECSRCGFVSGGDAGSNDYDF
jgi:hypothetical protein